ncbi:MAG: FtsH protease activity modulator HflK [Gammaproteobacteria bacterium]|nr:FtsH protease activity modulator HflK [Gammaproteobacteria bacterium]NNM13604.1 FtsH protease activity modulator HflK [Gammaproteobacteria bacterium]
MAWQDPNDKDPWKQGGKKNQQDELDQMAKELQDKLKKFFGGGGKGGNGKNASSGMPQFGLLLGLLLVMWAATGFYKVDQAEKGIVKRFGEYTRTTDPGLHWHVPKPIETITKVNVDRVREKTFDKIMLTQDENIVDVDLNVQYQVSDPVKFLFNVRSQETTLLEVSQSAIREIVGKNILDFIITEGRAVISETTRSKIQETLDGYDIGLRVLTVNLVDANFPQEVNDAVQDAIRAREDKETAIFAAETYANDIVPKSRGEAGKRLEDASAYKQREIADAQGEASRFEQLLVEYEKAPEVTRKRLYLETAEEVYGNTGKVIMDSKGSGNLVYLPVDQLINKNNRSTESYNESRDVVPQAQKNLPSRSDYSPRERPNTRGGN